jgi:alpha-ribazole phosphatase
MRLYLIRHPQPEVSPGTCYGQSDLSVSPEQLNQVSIALRARLPAQAVIFTSPLQRCSQLARALSPQAILDPRLAELDFGDWEMQPWSDIARSEIDAWSDDIAHYRPGNGESVSAMATRIAAFYADLQLLAHDHVAVVCHAGSIRLLSHCGQGLDAAEMAQRASQHAHNIACGEIVTLELQTCAVD